MKQTHVGRHTNRIIGQFLPSSLSIMYAYRWGCRGIYSTSQMVSWGDIIFKCSNWRPLPRILKVHLCELRKHFRHLNRWLMPHTGSNNCHCLSRNQNSPNASNSSSPYGHCFLEHLITFSPH